MNSFDSDPGAKVPSILLSAAAEMEVAIEEGRAMNVHAISEHDIRVLNHPWYTCSAHDHNHYNFQSVSANSQSIFDPSQSIPPRLGRAGMSKSELSAGPSHFLISPHPVSKDVPCPTDMDRGAGQANISNNSDSDHTLVEDESSSDESSAEDSNSSYEEDDGEAQWESGSVLDTRAMEDFTNVSTGTGSPLLVITSNVQEMEGPGDDSTGNVSRPHSMIPQPISLDMRIPLPAREESDLVHPGNRIIWEEQGGGDEIAGRPGLDLNATPVRKRRRSPSSSSDEVMVISHHTRQRSPSVEIISYMDRREVHHARASVARRERQRLFMEEALRTDGFVFTGFRIV
ncbi:hypothetical protein HWV62_19305 [Athelia sp. TMB]|nr:hypothetical protein HWV62_19305 [Athelia sp. TMB]